MNPVSTAPAPKTAMGCDSGQEIPIGDDAGHFSCDERGAEPSKRITTIVASRDDFRNHRVVVHADDIAFAHSDVDSKLGVLVGQNQVVQSTAGRKKFPLRIFGIESSFDCVTGLAYVVLKERQRFTGGHPQLPLHEVQARYQLRHRVLHLQTRIHLQEIEVACDS